MSELTPIKLALRSLPPFPSGKPGRAPALIESAPPPGKAVLRNWGLLSLFPRLLKSPALRRFGWGGGGISPPPKAGITGFFPPQILGEIPPEKKIFGTKRARQKGAGNPPKKKGPPVFFWGFFFFSKEPPPPPPPSSQKNIFSPKKKN
eukprot:FR741240.1.p3 GENE.FR741240.1~~FR741240.1.p3  ORF type:complete len:148 (+),score=79.37 FR741240.1:790-1233(+)